MKLYRTTLFPTSSFMTPLKGDTFFGMICWAIRYKFGEERLKHLLEDYNHRPFLIVSDGFLTGFLPKPVMSSSMLGEDRKFKKENRAKKWLYYEDFINASFERAKTTNEVSGILEKQGFRVCRVGSEVVVKNTINYLSFISDDPYSEMEFALPPQDVYMLLDEDKFSLEELDEVVRFSGHLGYGKKASIGKGRFEIDSFIEIEQCSGTTFMTLAPCVLQGTTKIKDYFYEPFTRFGKHGGYLASTGRFEKSPVLMADTGAVVIFEESCDVKFVGRMITGHSEQKEAVHQGYSIVLSMNLAGR